MSYCSLWSAEEVRQLREQIGLNRTQFARLVGVDSRTVLRWESEDGPRPTGSAAAVLSGIFEQLEGDPKSAPRLIQVLAGAAAVGGLSYLLVKLFKKATREDS